MFPMKVCTLLDGKKHLEGEYVELRLLDKIKEKEFAKPE